MDHILSIKSKKTLKKKKIKIQLYTVSKKQLYIQRHRQTKSEIIERYTTQFADDTTLTVESEQELKSLLMEGEREEWKS